MRGGVSESVRSGKSSTSGASRCSAIHALVSQLAESKQLHFGKPLSTRSLARSGATSCSAHSSCSLESGRKPRAAPRDTLASLPEDIGVCAPVSAPPDQVVRGPPATQKWQAPTHAILGERTPSTSSASSVLTYATTVRDFFEEEGSPTGLRKGRELGARPRPSGGAAVRALSLQLGPGGGPRTPGRLFLPRLDRPSHDGRSLTRASVR
eukprot:TRINITY_DN21132_c0_g1_i1.p1 TRINITY_DN21132_c0_g1~~TRINITY_DN21132_c0_g1_i1.p1  ORF type:complete len:209 (+),score=23.19 TRINITY_DN21132_c0_g1_i1:184-810(+)